MAGLQHSSSGALSYDPDGTGAASAVQFAELPPRLTLSNQDFLIIRRVMR
jgi:serralysin